MSRFATQYKNLRRSRKHLAVFVILYLFLAYSMASRAIETGSIWQYGLTFIFVYASIDSFVTAVNIKGGRKK